MIVMEFKENHDSQDEEISCNNLIILFHISQRKKTELILLADEEADFNETLDLDNFEVIKQSPDH